MDLTQTLTVVMVVATNLITVITLYLHLDNKSEKILGGIRDDIKNFQKAISEEMRDFHGRLISIEERNKK